MFVYPSVLPLSAQAFRLESKQGYNPQNDIVLSIEYAISGHSLTEAGLCFYITNNSSVFGGMSGSDLCYSGSNPSTGITSAIVGLGIDSTGSFGLSSGVYDVLSSSVVELYRDGYAEEDRIPNSATVRGGNSDNYALSTFNYYHPLSSEYSIIGDSFQPRALRFRLGDVGRTLYLDYKNDLDDRYKPLVIANIGDYIDTNQYYKIGFGFTTPVSAYNDSSIANFFFKNIHVEGRVSALSGRSALTEFWEGIAQYWPDIQEVWSL